MDAIQALTYANIGIWLGMGIYGLFLAKKQSELNKRLNAFIAQNQTKNQPDFSITAL